MVTIVGTDLGDGTDILGVQINGVDCSMGAQTSTRVIVTAPASAVSGAVSVATLSNRFGAGSATIYTYNQPPVISSLVPAEGPVYGGTNVTINGSFMTYGGADLVNVTFAGMRLQPFTGPQPLW